MKTNKLPLFIMAIESDLGCGRNMDIYYKNLINSSKVTPIMVYSLLSAYKNAPSWIKNKIVYDMPYTTHYLEQCFSDCKLTPEEHFTHEKWTNEFIDFIYFLKRIYGDSCIWLIDHPLPELEKAMKKNIVQIFHGELFKIGPASYYKKENIQSFCSYSRMLVSGQMIFDETINYAKLSSKDNRIRIIGRVLNDTLYDGTLKKEKILKQYNLNLQNKTILYAPSWESLKIWPIGHKEDDVANLNHFCNFISENNLNLIIRPHPICLHQYNIKPKIMSVLKNFKNVYFDDSSNSSYFGPNKSIIAADVMLTDLSTISVDFMSLGKPVVYLYPDNTQGLWGEYFPNFKKVAAISYAVKNFNQLFVVIKKLISEEESDKIKNQRKKIVFYVLGNIDGNAGKNFAMEIDGFALEVMKKKDSYLNKLKSLLFGWLAPDQDRPGSLSFLAQIIEC